MFIVYFLFTGAKLQTIIVTTKLYYIIVIILLINYYNYKFNFYFIFLK